MTIINNNYRISTFIKNITFEGSELNVVVIKIKKGESIEKSLRKLKKTMDREGTMKILRANRYFEKPSEKKRKKSARARARKRMLSLQN